MRCPFRLYAAPLSIAIISCHQPASSHHAAPAPDGPLTHCRARVSLRLSSRDSRPGPLCVDLRHALPHSRRHEDRRFLRQFINLRPAPRTPPTTTTSAFMFSPWSSPRSSFLLASLLAYSLGSSPATTTLHLQPSLYGLRIGRDEWHRSLQQELQAFQAYATFASRRLPTPVIGNFSGLSTCSFSFLSIAATQD